MSLGDLVKKIVGDAPPVAADTTAPAPETDTVLDVPKRECPYCHGENVVVEAHPYAGLEQHPQKLWRCLNPYCRQWGALPVAE